MKLFTEKGASYRLTRIAMGGALLCLLAPLSLPLAGGVPLTLGSFAAILAGLILGPREGTAATALYLALGAVGLPVFSGYRGGVGHLLGPTGGFLIGFLVLTFFSGLFRERKWRFSGVIAGEILLYLVGTVWFMVSAKAEFTQALLVCCLPFLPGDAVKCALALLIYRAFRRRFVVIKKQRSE